MPVGTLIAFCLFAGGALLFLVELWLQVWSPETFWKLIVTDGVLIVLVVIAAFLFRERRASERLSNKHELD